MRNALLLIGLLAVGGWFLKVKLDAGRQRKDVLLRLHEEGMFTGASSPTEALFRESGVPIPEAMRAGLVTATPAVKPPKGVGGATAPVTPTSDLAAVFAGIRLPCDLAPLSGVTGGDLRTHAGFWTDASHAAALGDALRVEFDRLGCTTRWIDGLTAHVSAPAGAAMLSIHSDPATVVGADGAPAFPTAPAHSVVVRLTAL